GFDAPSFADIDHLLARARPDAVVVSAALGARAEIARRALSAGAAILIEKPIALAYGESARLADDARQARRPLMISHPLLHQPVFARASEAIREGAIGEVKQVRASVYVSRVFNAPAAQRLNGGHGGGVVAYATLDLLALLI